MEEMGDDLQMGFVEPGIAGILPAADRDVSDPECVTPVQKEGWETVTARVTVSQPDRYVCIGVLRRCELTSHVR